MPGRTTSQPMPASNAAKPTRTNASGNVTDGAFAPGAGAAATGRAGDGSATADMGKETAIGLLLGLGGEAALFEMRIQMHWPAVGTRAQLHAGGQCGRCFKDLDHRLRWFEPGAAPF